MPKIFLSIGFFIPFIVGQVFAQYELPSEYVQIDDPKNTWKAAVDQDGISKLSIIPFEIFKLPLCVELKDVTNKEVEDAISLALKIWNEKSQSILGKDLFKVCPKESSGKYPVVIWCNSKTGDKNDNQIKFAEVFMTKMENPKIVMLLREQELLEYEGTIDQLIAGAFKGKTQNPELFTKFKIFKENKIKTMIAQIMTHELGHVIGLGHNFNKSENSIMDYSERSTLSEYDEDAIRSVFGLKIKKKWQASSSLSK